MPNDVEIAESDSVEGDFSVVADRQLDDIEAGSDPALYNAILDTCELVFRLPSQARSLGSAIATEQGIVFRLSVRGHFPYKVFWSVDGPRIEAIIPHP